MSFDPSLPAPPDALVSERAAHVLDAADTTGGVTRVSVVVRPGRVLGLILLCWLPLLALSVGGQLYLYVFGGTHTRVPKRLNVDSELTPASWFQSSLLLSCAFLLALAALAAYRSRARFAGHWAFLAFVFVYLSIDEAAAIHELSISYLHDWLDTSGIFFFAWVIPAMMLVAVMAIFYARFFVYLPRHVRTLFFCAAAAYLGGAIGGDLVGGYWFDKHGGDNLTYALMTQVEETLETTGAALLVYTVLTHLRLGVSEWTFRLRD